MENKTWGFGLFLCIQILRATLFIPRFFHPAGFTGLETDWIALWGGMNSSRLNSDMGGAPEVSTGRRTHHPSADPTPPPGPTANAAAAAAATPVALHHPGAAGTATAAPVATTQLQPPKAAEGGAAKLPHTLLNAAAGAAGVRAGAGAVGAPSAPPAAFPPGGAAPPPKGPGIGAEGNDPDSNGTAAQVRVRMGPGLVSYRPDASLPFSS